MKYVSVRKQNFFFKPLQESISLSPYKKRKACKGFNYVHNTELKNRPYHKL